MTSIDFERALGWSPGLAFVFALNLVMLPGANSGEKQREAEFGGGKGGGTQFTVREGYLSASVRKLVVDHGWSLIWDSEEDRVVDRSFHVPNPSLAAGLSNIFLMYKGAFVADLYQGNKVARVTAAPPGVSVHLPEGMTEASPPQNMTSDEALPDALLPASGADDMPPAELIFEPDLKPDPIEEEMLTVQMLDLPQMWESVEPEPNAMPKIVASLAIPPEPESPPKPRPRAESNGEMKFVKARGGSWGGLLLTKAKEIGFDMPKTALSDSSPRPVLQIMSVKDKKKAETELSHLRALGFDAYLQPFRQGETLWHRLQVRLAPGQSVESVKAEMKDNGYEAIWVVPQDFAQTPSPAKE